ncbi:hypothetical protein FB451DRAFT_1190539 [Mycena latifolia]|nr:hypothetical protein FB451DRAFT_1190539 [Mycena latifolia]
MPAESKSPRPLSDDETTRDLSDFWSLCQHPSLLNFVRTYWGVPPPDSPEPAVPSLGLTVPDNDGKAQFVNLLFSIMPEFPGATPESFGPEETEVLTEAEWNKLRNAEVMRIPALLTKRRHGQDDNLVVFKEFKLLWEFVDEGPADNEIHIVGSPGIGKSCSLFYILITHGQVYRSFRQPDEAIAWISQIPTPDPVVPDCVLVDAGASSGNRLSPFWAENFGCVVFASTAPDHAFAGTAIRFIMNPPTVTETVAALLHNNGWEDRIHKSLWSEVDAFQDLLQTFGPSPGTIFTATKSFYKRRILAAIEEQMRGIPWKTNVRLVSCEDPSLADISTLPSRAITFIRKAVYIRDENGNLKPNIHCDHDLECIWSSLTMRAILWKIAKKQRSEHNLQRYQATRGDPNAGPLIGSCWEALALDFLNGRYELHGTTTRLVEKTKKTNENGKYGPKGPATFYDYDPTPSSPIISTAPSPSVIPRTTPSAHIRRTSSSSPSPRAATAPPGATTSPTKTPVVKPASQSSERRRGLSGMSSMEEMPPPLPSNKRPASEDAQGPEPKKLKLETKVEDEEPLITPGPGGDTLSFFKARGSYRAPKSKERFQHFQPDILYLPATMNPLFDAIGFHGDTIYLYQIFNRNGRGKEEMAPHGMASRGITTMKRYFPGSFDNYNIVFTAVVPKGAKARLIVSDVHKHLFKNFTFWVLEVNLDSLDILLSDQ